MGLRVLDAGCGGGSLTVPHDAYVVGLDVSPESLARNRRIDEAIVGDLESYPLEPGSFDLVVCQDVLEHLHRPVLAVQNMARALKAGGSLLIGVPNLWSAKGFLTKLTPHWLHVFVYRTLLAYEDAGKPGHGPYRTHLSGCSVRGLRQFARATGLTEASIRVYSGRPPRRWLLPLWFRSEIRAEFVRGGPVSPPRDPAERAHEDGRGA